jgi:rod shape-determining protein MreD
MSLRRLQWLVLVSVLTAFFLSILPLPDSLAWARPQWVALLLIYWILELPDRVGMGTTFVVGLLLDGLHGTVFGHNALTLCFLAYLVLILYKRLRMFGMWQQMLLVFILIGLEQLVYHWVQTMVGRPAPDLLFLISCVASTLAWPVVVFVLNGARRSMGVV